MTKDNPAKTKKIILVLILFLPITAALTAMVFSLESTFRNDQRFIQYWAIAEAIPTFCLICCEVFMLLGSNPVDIVYSWCVK